MEIIDFLQYVKHILVVVTDELLLPSTGTSELAF